MQLVSLFLLSSVWIANCFMDFWPRAFDPEKEFPYAVSLQMNYHPYSRLCTGSLLSEKWVITAGQCIHDSISTAIRHGEFTMNATTARSYVGVIKTFRHPGYDGRFLRNDIALMLIEQVPARTFAKLLAVDYKGLLGLPVKFAGFEKTSFDRSPNIRNEDDEVRPLQKGDGVIMSCPHSASMSGPAICVAPKCSDKVQSNRQGYSGGPLLFDGKIIGVLSSANVNTMPFSYYASLSPHLEWIYDVMNKTY